MLKILLINLSNDKEKHDCLNEKTIKVLNKFGQVLEKQVDDESTQVLRELHVMKIMNKDGVNDIFKPNSNALDKRSEDAYLKYKFGKRDRITQSQ